MYGSGQEIGASSVSRQSAHEGDNVSPTHWPPLPPRNIPWQLEWSLSSSLTQLVYLMVEVYLHYYLKYNYMFRLSNNSHLQVIHESLENSYTSNYYGLCTVWCVGGGVGT